MATYIKIATVTVGAGGASSIDFTSISSAYTDLLIELSGRTTSANRVNSGTIRFNGSSATYTFKRVYGDGSTAASDSSEGYSFNGGTSTSNTFSNVSFYIPNYAGSTTKSFSIDSSQEDNQTSAYNILIAGLWNGTAAINQITFASTGNTLAQYSSATLYGISKS